MRKRQRILKKKKKDRPLVSPFPFLLLALTSNIAAANTFSVKRREKTFSVMQICFSLSLFLSAYVPRNVVELKSRWELKTDSVANFFIIRRTNFPILLRARRANRT